MQVCYDTTTYIPTVKNPTLPVSLSVKVRQMSMSDFNNPKPLYEEPNSSSFTVG
jgi:hypothetical protein